MSINKLYDALLCCSIKHSCRECPFGEDHTSRCLDTMHKELMKELREIYSNLPEIPEEEEDDGE